MPNTGKTKSTIMVDSDLWKRLRIIAILNEMEISELVEQALREKLSQLQQPEENAAYKDVEKIRMPKEERPAKQEQVPRNVGPIYDYYEVDDNGNEILVHAGSEEDIKRLGNALPGTLQIRLPGIKFPADRNEIIECAQNANVKTVTNTLKDLPNRPYKTVGELEKTLPTVFKGEYNTLMKAPTGRYVKIKQRFSRFLIDTKEITERERQQEELLQKQR